MIFDCSNPACMIKGIYIAIVEIVLYIIISGIFYVSTELNTLDFVTYMWACFTVLTGIWEISYIMQYTKTCEKSTQLILSNKRVWTEKYSLKWILPWNLPVIFYAEYGAFADREYMTITDFWSKLIEGTHAFFCGFFTLLSLICYHFQYTQHFTIFITLAMGGQLMNSILYCGQYIIQVSDPCSVNHDSEVFPYGKFGIKRPFMYINAFWTIMPIYVIIQLLY